MSSERISPRQACHINASSLPVPTLEFPLNENVSSEEFPLDREHPFVAQEQARRVIAASLADDPCDSACWLVGSPRSGRHTLVKYLVEQAGLHQEAVYQVLLPSVKPHVFSAWMSLPAAEGAHLVGVVENGLRAFQRDLCGSEQTESACRHLREHWQELSDSPYAEVREFSAVMQEQLFQRASVMQYRLHNSNLGFFDDLITPLYRYCWKVLTRGSGAGIHKCSANEDELFCRIYSPDEGAAADAERTEFRAGVMLRAQGGILIMDGDDLPNQPQVWAKCRQVLKHKCLSLRNVVGGEILRSAFMDGCRIPLSARLFIAITPENYLKLAELDPDLNIAVPYKAEFADSAWINEVHKREFCAYLVQWAKQYGGPGFAIDGIAALLYYCSQQAGDCRRFSLLLGQLDPILRRASQVAQQRQAALIKEQDVEAALRWQREQSQLLEDELNLYTASDIIHIETTGAVVGQVNGLTVVEQPEGAFGRPQRITAVVYASKDGVLDIERECQNGGRLHSKGTLILSGYILGCIGGLHTWPIGISICMEQSYESIDGDSASSAEAYAALSALADVPLSQEIAATGSIDQLGNVQAVGGIVEKIQGFYKLCATRGLTGTQGVIIPRANLNDLVLDREVREAIAAGQFHLWAVSTVAEGMEILSGLPMGKLRGDRYPKRSIMGKIQVAADDTDR